MHLWKHIVCLNEFVGDTHALGLHGVVDAVGVGADVGWGGFDEGKEDGEEGDSRS